MEIFGLNEGCFFEKWEIIRNHERFNAVDWQPYDVYVAEFCEVLAT